MTNVTTVDIYQYFQQVIATSDRPVVCEIGAAYGDDTTRLVQLTDAICRQKGVDSFEYYAFEPDPRNISALKRSAVRDQFTLIEAAVGSRNERATFRMSDGGRPDGQGHHTLSGSLKEPIRHFEVWPHITFQDTATVRVLRLDDAMSIYSFDHIDFIWCDVQGAEDMVIDGGINALKRTRYFYTEFYDIEVYSGQLPLAEIHRRLPGRWRIVERYPTDVLFENLEPWV